MINIINQVFEIEQKLKLQPENIAERNFKRIYHELELLGYKVIDPLLRDYKETDTDIEVSLSGDMKGRLLVTKVLKPIIYQEDNGHAQLVQKGIAIVEGVSGK
jgi:hypothetical protein